MPLPDQAYVPPPEPDKFKVVLEQVRVLDDPAFAVGKAITLVACVAVAVPHELVDVTTIVLVVFTEIVCVVMPPVQL